MLSRRPGDAGYQATIANLNARTRAWWLMVAIFFLAMLSGGIGSVILFGFTSFLALREFVTMTPTRHGDHDTLLWLFFVITPIQYWLVAIGWYGLFAIFIPVYAFLFVPLRSVLSGDCEHFLERTATIQWALMICVYCVSHAPALLTLEIPGFEGQNGKLLFYFVLVVQASDVLQYIWGKLFGKHKIAPTVSPNKTWEGFLGGVATATLLGTALWWATPFTPWQAAGMSLAITLYGLCRRFGDVRDQARSRRQGLRHPDPGARRGDGSDRLALFLRAGLLSSDTLLFRTVKSETSKRVSSRSSQWSPSTQTGRSLAEPTEFAAWPQLSNVRAVLAPLQWDAPGSRTPRTLPTVDGPSGSRQIRTPFAATRFLPRTIPRAPFGFVVNTGLGEFLKANESSFLPDVPTRSRTSGVFLHKCDSLRKAHEFFPIFELLTQYRTIDHLDAFLDKPPWRNLKLVQDKTRLQTYVMLRSESHRGS